MRYRTIIAVLAVSATPLPARADFAIATAPLGFIQPGPHSAVRPAEPPTATIARGFGDHVPLSFAVRQIVPGTVKVTYGSGVDPEALVDWRGGSSWRVVVPRALH